jgi:hypothetical protein
VSERPDPETVPVELPTLTVSLAVAFVEGTTGRPPDEMPTASLSDVDVDPRPKSDRFLLFLDAGLPASPATTVVSVDGGDRYRDVTREVVVTREGDPPAPPEPETYPASEPVVTVHLFGPEDTVFRGVVRDGAGGRIGGGTLSVTELGFDLVADVDANGRFVLRFDGVPAEGDVTAELETPPVEDPLPVTLPLVAGEETVRTLVVDGGTVSVEEVV